MPAGTASSVAMVAEASASHRLFQNDCMKSGCANTAANQRSEKLVVGMVSVFSGVNATMHTTSSGASMQVMTSALNARAKGPFLLMRSAQRFLVAAFYEAVVAQHHDKVDCQQRERDGRAQRPVQFAQVLVVHHRRDHLEASSAQQPRDRE